MTSRPTKEEISIRLLEETAERWGEETAEELKPDIERVGEAIWQVEGFKLLPEDEPSRPLRRV